MHSGQRRHEASVKMTAKDTQMYKNIYVTFYAQVTLQGGLRSTPPKSHFMQSTPTMWPNIHQGIAIYLTRYCKMYWNNIYVLANVLKKLKGIAKCIELTARFLATYSRIHKSHLKRYKYIFWLNLWYRKHSSSAWFSHNYKFTNLYNSVKKEKYKTNSKTLSRHAKRGNVAENE